MPGQSCALGVEGGGGITGGHQGASGKDCLGVEPSQSLRATGRLTAGVAPTLRLFRAYGGMDTDGYRKEKSSYTSRAAGFLTYDSLICCYYFRSCKYYFMGFSFITLISVYDWVVLHEGLDGLVGGQSERVVELRGGPVAVLGTLPEEAVVASQEGRVLHLRLVLED